MNKKIASEAVFTTAIVAMILVILIFLGSCLLVVSAIIIDSRSADTTYKRLESFDEQINSNNFLHRAQGDFCIDGNVYDSGLKTPYSNLKVSERLECYYFGATNSELFYYVEAEKSLDFYKSNYKNSTYELIRSFNYNELLYHKSGTVIYVGNDSKTYIYDAFELTDAVYEEEIPVHTPRYTVSKYSSWFCYGKLKHQCYIIKDNVTGEEKDLRKLKNVLQNNAQVKELNAKYIEYVFCHDDSIYIVYNCVGVVVTFAFDFENETLSLVNWGKLDYGCGVGKTYYLDRVKFAE